MISNEFVYVTRKESPEDTISYLKNSKLCILYSQDKSGLSHFLKQTQRVISRNNDSPNKWYCFYIDSRCKDSIATQIVKQILNASNYHENTISRIITKKQFKGIIQSILNSISITFNIGFTSTRVNVGELLEKLVSSIEDTLNVDLAHSGDYKLELAVIKILEKIEQLEPEARLFYLFDNAELIRISDFERMLVKHSTSRVLFAFSANTGLEEKSKKISSISMKPQHISWTFEYPDDDFIIKIFKELNGINVSKNDSLLNEIKMHGRNIHIIMGLVNEVENPMDEDMLDILKILSVVNKYNEYIKHPVMLSKDMIFKIVTHYQLKFERADENLFINKINSLVKYGLINMQDDFLQQRNSSYAELSLSPREIIQIPHSILNIFEEHKHTFTIEQCKYAIMQYRESRNPTATKNYVLNLLDLERSNSQMGRKTYKSEIKQDFLDLVSSFNSLSELLKICVAYYNQLNYLIPLEHMVSKDNKHLRTENPRAYDTMLVLLQERLHKGKYASELQKLVKTTSNINEKCLLAAVLFVARLNSNEKGIANFKEILEEKSSELYYKNFRESKYYSYLLNSIGFYIKSPAEGISNYESLLTSFRGRDVISYNRTISNYLCYLMHNSQCSPLANNRLINIAKEAEHILNYYDERWKLLNINYGLYLMMTNTGNAHDYFDRIPLEPVTSPTSYIFSQINKAMYFAKHGDKNKAFSLLDSIYEQYISLTSVPHTEGLYYVNRSLLEYINNDEAIISADEITVARLRGDIDTRNQLVKFYKDMNNLMITYTDDFWEKLFKLGYVFYRNIDPSLLLSEIIQI